MSSTFTEALATILAFGTVVCSFVGCKPRQNESPDSNIASDRSLPNEVGFDTAREKCIYGVDWTKREPQISAPEDYLKNFFDNVVEAPVKGLMSVTGGIDWVVSWVVPSRYGISLQLQYLVNDMKKVQKRFQNSKKKDFLSACLAKCVAANLIEYEGNVHSKFGNVCTIAAKGKGVCTEFAKLGNYFGEQLGVPSRLIGNIGMGHAYNAFYISSEKKWYYAEPQRDSCGFMDLDYHRSIEKFHHERTGDYAEIFQGPTGKLRVGFVSCNGSECSTKFESGDLRLIKSTGYRGSKRTLANNQQYLRANAGVSGYVVVQPTECYIDYISGLISPTSIRFKYQGRDRCDNVRSQVSWSYNFSDEE